MANIKSTHQLTCNVSELTAGIINEFLEPVDSEAKVTVKVAHGDRPGEVSTVTMSADVDIQKGRIY